MPKLTINLAAIGVVPDVSVMIYPVFRPDVHRRGQGELALGRVWLSTPRTYEPNSDGVIVAELEPSENLNHARYTLIFSDGPAWIGVYMPTSDATFNPDLFARPADVVVPTTRYTLVSATTAIPTEAIILSDGTASNEEQLIAVTNPGYDGHLIICSPVELIYIGFTIVGGNQIGGFEFTAMQEINGYDYFLRISNQSLVARAWDLDWYAY